MNKQQWKKISRIFDIALSLPSYQRTSYVKNLCPDDTELQQEIEELLASVQESDQLLEEHLEKNIALINELDTSLGQEPALLQSKEGESIRGWQIMEMLGQGGMGAVYKARRTTDGVQQTAAIKVLHQGFTTPENIKRFRLEQQILASLHHPNIAQLIDGGVSDCGEPYLAMEYVEGIAIHNYCKKHNLSIAERLNLFSKVCSAVQHAHQNLIVHRDLKPDNILVTEGKHVKILDFGIAKLLDPDFYDISPIETRESLRLMSLEYAAPEQISGKAITTSTDIYALGTLLYEILTGLHPFDFDEKKFRAIEQDILYKDPKSPSNRLSNVQRLKSAPLIKKLKGDLDAIILKALRKEPEGRYQAVSNLVDDLELYKTDKPVFARLGSARYQVSKFFKRHKKGFGIAASALVTIFSLIVFYTFQLAKERDQAQLEAQKAQQVKNLLTKIFQSGDPFIEPDAKNLTVQKVLDEGTQKISTELKSQPIIQAELQEALGNVYSGLIIYDKAEPLLQKALSTYKKELHANHPNIARASHRLGFVLFREGNYQSALSLYKDARNIYENTLGKSSSQFAYATKMIADVCSETGKSEQALKYYKKALAIYKETDSPEIASATQDLGYLLMGIGQFKEAQQNLQKAITLYKYYYQEPEIAIANAYTGLGQTKHLQGDLIAAIEYHRKALNIRQGIFEKGHTHIASSHLRLGWALVEQGKIKEAIPMIRKAHKSFSSHLPENHWKIAATEGVLALAWIGQDKFKLAEKTLLNTHEVFKKQFGQDDWRTQNAHQTLKKLYKAWNKPQIAKKIVVE